MDAELKRLLEYLLNGESPPEKVIVFGSYAEGKVGEWSDLDVVVIQRTDLPFMERIRRFYREFKPRVAMDVLFYTPEEFRLLVRSRRFLREEVLRRGRVVYERSKELA